MNKDLQIQTDWSKIDLARSSLRTPRILVNHLEGEEVKFVEYDFNDKKRFPKPPNSIEITHLTDLQYGSHGFQEERFLKYREWILSSPNRFVVLGGDLIDAATINLRRVSIRKHQRAHLPSAGCNQDPEAARRRR